AELVFGHFTDRAHAAVAEVIDIVHHTLAVADVDQATHGVDDVLAGQGTETLDFVAPEAAVELHAADRGQVVALQGEEQVVEQVLGWFMIGRLSGASHGVDLQQRLELGVGVFTPQGVGYERITIQVVGVDDLDRANTGGIQLVEGIGGDFGVSFKQQLPGAGMDDVLGQHAAMQILGGHFEGADVVVLELADMARGDPSALLDDDLATLALDVEAGDLAPQPTGLQFKHVGTGVGHREGAGLEEHAENFLGVVAEGTQQDGGGQLAAAVDADEQLVLGVEFEVEPGTAIGDDARGIEQ